MKMRYVLAVVCVLLATACYGGSYKVIGNYDPTQQAFSGVVIPGNADSAGSCPPLPVTFKESDLVGTWDLFAGVTGVVTLTLRADGTYKYDFEYPPTGYHYEGNWKRWELERRSNGTALVHFQEMPFAEKPVNLSIVELWLIPASSIKGFRLKIMRSPWY